MTSKTKAKPKEIDPEITERMKALVEQSKTARLNPPQEDEAAQALRAVLGVGRSALPDVVEALLALPWNVGVNAVNGAWADLKPVARKYLLAALGKEKSDVSKRVRLSIARGLFPQDAETAAVLAVGVCEDMRGETGALSPKDRQIFSNVLIGKGKPWLAHFSLSGWEPDGVKAFAASTVDACFGGPCAPFTQIALVRWLSENGALATLPENSLAMIAKTAKRWNPRMRKQLSKEVPELPAPIAEIVSSGKKTDHTFSTEPPQAAEQHESAPGEIVIPAVAAEPDEAAAPAVETREPVSVPEPEWQPQQQEAHAHSPPPPPAQKAPYYPQQEHQQRRHADRGQRRNQPHQQPQPPQRGQQRGGSAAGEFDVGQTLRQIEAYVVGLHKELYEAQGALRRLEREPQQQQHRGGSPRFTRGGGGAESGAVSQREVEELQRHNAQLEQTVADLRQQLEELAADHEDQAAAMRAHEPERPETDETEQFKTLLGIKLRDLFTEYETLRKESADDVVRQHFGDMLETVFSILSKQGVRLSE